MLTGLGGEGRGWPGQGWASVQQRGDRVCDPLCSSCARGVVQPEMVRWWVGGAVLVWCGTLEKRRRRMGGGSQLGLHVFAGWTSEGCRTGCRLMAEIRRDG